MKDSANKKHHYKLFMRDVKARIDETSKYDLVILKDVLQHWSNNEIIHFLDIQAGVRTDTTFLIKIGSIILQNSENSFPFSS